MGMPLFKGQNQIPLLFGYFSADQGCEPAPFEWRAKHFELMAVIADSGCARAVQQFVGQFHTPIKMALEIQACHPVQISVALSFSLECVPRAHHAPPAPMSCIVQTCLGHFRKVEFLSSLPDIPPVY